MPSPIGTVVAGLALALAFVPATRAADFTLESSIRLPNVTGRIDHLATDLDNSRLFVAEHDNGTLDVVSLAAKKPTARITGLAEPQGVAFVGGSNRIAVGNGGDGSLRLFDATTLSKWADVEIGRDADNVRIEPKGHRVVVGYGDGGLAVIDPKSGHVVRKVELGAHPEGFQIDGDGTQAYVNLPDKGEIGVVDLDTGEQSSFPTPELGGNFPMAFEHETGRLAVVFRQPAQLALIDPAARSIVATVEACGDADDVFFDAPRSLIYTTCGAGVVDIIKQDGDKLTPIAQVKTANGARTGLFVPELDRLFVAAPAANGKDAQIMVLKPSE